MAQQQSSGSQTMNDILRSRSATGQAQIQADEVLADAWADLEGSIGDVGDALTALEELVEDGTPEHQQLGEVADALLSTIDHIEAVEEILGLDDDLLEPAQ